MGAIHENHKHFNNFLDILENWARKHYFAMHIIPIPCFFTQHTAYARNLSRKYTICALTDVAECMAATLILGKVCRDK